MNTYIIIPYTKQKQIVQGYDAGMYLSIKL